MSIYRVQCNFTSTASTRKTKGKDFCMKMTVEQHKEFGSFLCGFRDKLQVEMVTLCDPRWIAWPVGSTLMR